MVKYKIVDQDIKVGVLLLRGVSKKFIKVMESVCVCERLERCMFLVYVPGHLGRFEGNQNVRLPVILVRC